MTQRRKGKGGTALAKAKATHDEAVAKALADRDREAADAWRRLPSTGADDPWTNGIAMAAMGDVEPLAAYLKEWSVKAWLKGDPILEKRLNDLAGVIRMLHLKTHTRGQGRPKGTLDRMKDPNQVAVMLVEKRQALWMRENGRDNVPAEVTKQLGKQTVAEVATWAYFKKKKPTSEAVLNLLKRPRSDRLPPLA
jgi:hypothetical protein